MAHGDALELRPVADASDHRGVLDQALTRPTRSGGAEAAHGEGLDGRGMVRPHEVGGAVGPVGQRAPVPADQRVQDASLADPGGGVRVGGRVAELPGAAQGALGLSCAAEQDGEVTEDGVADRGVEEVLDRRNHGLGLEHRTRADHGIDCADEEELPVGVPVGEPARLQERVGSVRPGAVGGLDLGHLGEPVGEPGVGAWRRRRQEREPAVRFGDDVGGFPAGLRRLVRAHEVEHRGPDHGVARSDDGQRAPAEPLHEAVARRLAERTEHVVEAGGACDLVEARRLAEAGGGLDESPRVGGESSARLLDADSDLTRSRQAQVRHVPHLARQLVQEGEHVARVAVGVTSEPFEQPRRQGATPVRAEFLEVAGRERSPGHRGVGDAPEQVGRDGRTSSGVGRQQRHHGHLAVVADERRERSQRFLIGPLGVVDDEKDSLALRPVDESASDGERVLAVERGEVLVEQLGDDRVWAVRLPLDA